jgi:hypothetical protein
MTSLRFSRIAVALAATVVVAGPVSSASATTNGVSLYISAPFVQGSSYSGGDVALEDFEAFSTGAGACLGSSAVGTISNTCMVANGDGAGGATVTNDTPTVGGSASKYAATPWPSGGAEIDITFPQPLQYIGLWWSAGNVESGSGITNFIEFYNGDQLLTTMTANDLMTLLGGSVPNPYPGTATLASQGGTDYNIGYYYGDPTGHSSTSPTGKSTVTGDFPFVYLNLFTSGDTRVDKIVIGGDGFEFDNLATSPSAQTPTQDMVFVTEYADTVTDSGSSGGGSGGSSNGGSTTNLAATGFDPAMPVIVGAGLVGAGIVAQRRRRARATN